MARAFLFDLDGTLVDSERENAESVERVLAARGRPLSDEERRYVVGHGWREIYARLCGAGGVDLSFDELKEAAGEEKERIVLERGLRVLPGAVECVRLAARLGAVTVVSGSSRREIAFCLRLLELAPVVPWFVGAEDTARGKPAPDGYLLAADKLGVAPAECVVFEDSAAGIAAARAAGMRCIAVAAGNFAAQDQSAAHVTIPSLAALDEARLQAIVDGGRERA